MKFLQYLFENKNKFADNSYFLRLEPALKKIEKDFYGRISNLNKYTLGGEESFMNEVSIDIENNEHGMHHYSGKNDDNEENEDS